MIDTNVDEGVAQMVQPRSGLTPEQQAAGN
jgi:hypothetical protein